MRRSLIVVALGLVVLAAVVVLATRPGEPEVAPGAEPPSGVLLPGQLPDQPPDQLPDGSVAALPAGFLYGRVTTVDGAVLEGRLRFGGDEEALWIHAFNGAKDENPWAVHVPPRWLRERRPIEILGVRLGHWTGEVDLGRPFMVRFGDVDRIEAHGGDLRVTLKGGRVFHLDRFDADDFADGLRVWDAEEGVVDLHEVRIRSIELLPAAGRTPAPAPVPLYGTVRTDRAELTGFIQWNRAESLGSDALDGRAADGTGEPVSLRFDAIRSIERRGDDGSLVTLRDGREMALSGTREVGRGNLGVSVDDLRTGRVLVPWEAFERVDFGAGGSGGDAPAYGDFPPGRPLAGTVATRSGDRFSGRLVFDLDESETTETLDAPSDGVSYSIPLGRIASIVPAAGGEGGRSTRVILHGGEELRLEPGGDLAEGRGGNAGMLIFVDGRERPEYVPWEEVERIDLAAPSGP